MPCTSGDAWDSDDESITPESRPELFKKCLYCNFLQYINDYAGNHETHHTDCYVRKKLIERQFPTSMIREFLGGDAISARDLNRSPIKNLDHTVHWR